MKRYLILLATVFCLATACEYDFDPDIKSEPRIYVRCVAYDDSMLVKLKYAAPASQKGDIPEIKTELAEITVNGHAEGIPSGGRIDRHFLAGDKIGTRVKAEGLGEVTGSTVMPSKPAVSKVTKGFVPLIDSIFLTKFDIELESKPREGDFFAVYVLREDTYVTDSSTFTVDEFQRTIAAGNSESNLEYATLGYSNGIIEMFRGPVTLFPAKIFSGKTCSVIVTAMSYGPKNPSLVSTRYKLYVCKVSEALYRFSLSTYKSGSDILATLGLAPPQFAWSNIEGGMGVCGAITSTETDWVE